MNYINKFNRFVKQDIIYGLKSKVFLSFAAVLLIMFLFALFLGYSAVNEAYDSYKYYVSRYIETNEQDQTEDSEYEVYYNENSQLINNPLAYYKEMTSQYNYSMSYKYLPSMLMETSLIYFPFIFSIFGVIWGSYDDKYKTKRLKTLAQGKIISNLSKQISMIIGVISIFVSAFILAYLIGIILSAHINSILPGNIANKTFEPASSILLQIIFVFFVAVIFSEIGYTLVVCIKNTIICIGIILFYLIVLSGFGKYSIMNVVKFFAMKLFDFLGIVSIETSESLSTLPAIIVLLAIFTVCIVLNNVFTKVKSSY